MSKAQNPDQVLLISILRKGRLSKEETQLSIAKKLGKPQSWVSKVESGELELSVIDFIYLCQAIGLSPAQVIDSVVRGPGE